MPPKKKQKFDLAPDMGDGKPRKLVPMDNSAAGRARRLEQRNIRLADEAEAAAEQAARSQREQLVLEKSDMENGSSPEEDAGDLVQFSVTLDEKPKANNRVKPSVSNSRRGSEPVPTQFEVTLSGSEGAAREDLISDSHVRDFTEGAVAQPEVTAAIRRRKCPDNVEDWDKYLVSLLFEVFSSAKDVVLVLDTTIMAVRWWPLWKQAINNRMMPPGGGRPRVVVGLTLDDMHHLTQTAKREKPSKRGEQKSDDAIVSLGQAFSVWKQKKTSRLMVLVPLKDDGALHFAPGAKGGSLTRAFEMGKELQDLGIKCFLILMRGSLRDFAALRSAAAALVEGSNARKTTVYIATPESEEARQLFPRVHDPFELALRKWTEGICGDITPHCCARPYGAPLEEDAPDGRMSSRAPAPARAGSSSSSSFSGRADANQATSDEEWQRWPGVNVSESSSAAELREPAERLPSWTQTKLSRRDAQRAAESGQTSSVAHASESGARQHHLTKNMEERIRELQISESDTAFEVAKEVASMVGAVEQCSKDMQREVVLAVYYKLRGTKKHGRVMRDLAEGDETLINSGWSYFSKVLQGLEPEVDARRAAKKRFEDLVQGDLSIAAFNVQFQAALAGLDATGLARHCTFDSVVADYLERLTDQTVRVAVYQSYKLAKQGWASGGPLDRTGRDALRRMLNDTAEMVSKVAPGASAHTASAAAMGTSRSPPRERSERSQQPLREAGRISRPLHAEFEGRLLYDDLEPEDKAVLQHWAGPNVTNYLAYVAATRNQGVCYKCGKEGHWARDMKCGVSENLRPCKDWAMGKCRWGEACFFHHDYNTKPRVPQERNPAILPRKRPRSRTPSPARPVTPPVRRSGPVSSRADDRKPPGVCFEWKAKGNCARGAECRFSHVLSASQTPAAVPPICRNWKRGSCRFGEECRFAHESRGQQAGARKKARNDSGEHTQSSSANGSGAPRA